MGKKEERDLMDRVEDYFVITAASLFMLLAVAFLIIIYKFAFDFKLWDF